MSDSKPSGTVCRHCGKPEINLIHDVQTWKGHKFEPATAEQPRFSHNHSAGSDYCPACMASSVAEQPRPSQCTCGAGNYEPLYKHEKDCGLIKFVESPALRPFSAPTSRSWKRSCKRSMMLVHGEA